MKKQYWITPLLLVALIRAEFITTQAYSAWDQSQVTYDDSRDVYVDHYKIPLDNFIVASAASDPETAQKLAAMYDGPRDIPTKRKFVVKFRTDLFHKEESYACVSMMFLTKPAPKRRLVLVNVEQIINENIGADDRQYRVWPHLGLLYVGTVAYEEGWEVVMWDELVKGFAPMEQLVQPGDIVGFSCVTTGMERSINLARKAKELGARYIIAGNDSAIFRANQILALPDKPIDAVFTSNSLASVRKFFRESENVSLESLQIPGVQVTSGQVEQSNERDWLLVDLSVRRRDKAEGRFENNDVFVVPKLDLYPHWKEVWANYRATFGHKHSNPDSVKNGISLFAQGCTRTRGSDVCGYCAIYGVADIRMPQREYLRRIAEAYKTFGIDMVFNATDSIYEMGGVVKALQELGITWNAMSIYGRSQGITHNPGLLEQWQRVATERLLINVGMDSGDDKLLREGVVKSSINRKKTCLEENQEAVRLIQKAGAHLHYSLIFGIPGETLETCESSIRFLEWTIATLGSQLDICETDIYWLNFGSPASKVFHDYSEAQRFAALAEKSISKKEWYENFACHQEALVVPEVTEEAWYRYFTKIDLATAQVYNQRCQEIMARHTGSIRGRAFKPV